MLFFRLAVTISALAMTAGAGFSQEPCGLCEKEVVTNSSLAECFLSEYQDLAKQTGPAVAVDLSQCAEQSRGIVEALPTPNSGTAQPDLEFLVSRSQLDCLKKKLEEPGLKLDPTATIALDAC